MSDYTREPGEPLLCERCGCAITISRVHIEAVRLAERLFALDLCGPCWSLLLAAVQLELAGAGPGGHLELHAELLEPAGELADQLQPDPPGTG